LRLRGSFAPLPFPVAGLLIVVFSVGKVALTEESVLFRIEMLVSSSLFFASS